MSVRLPVVVVQSARMTNLQVGLVADIVVQLLGEASIDVAMVSSLQPTDEHSTDRLMLANLTTDFAVIDWCEPAAMLTHLTELGIQVQRAKHRLDLEVAAAVPGMRRVYLFDLRLGFRPSEVVQVLTQIRDQRNVVTVPLVLPGAGRKTPAPAQSTPATSQALPVTSANQSASGSLATPATGSSSMISANSPPASRSEVTSRTSARSVSNDDEDTLDSLVAELNDSEL